MVKIVLLEPQNGPVQVRPHSLPDSFMSYPGNSMENSYPSAVMQSVYYAAPTDLADSGYFFFSRLY